MVRELISCKERKSLEKLNNRVEELYLKEEYGRCEKMIVEAIGDYPHAPHPHNLYGVILEKYGDKHAAMSHYRAAIALEPSYRPARSNLNRYGDMSNRNTQPAFSDKDC